MHALLSDARVRRGMQLGATVDAQGGCAVTLEAIRSDLMREEDCIVFHLHARAQRPRNDAIYNAQQLPIQSFCYLQNWSINSDFPFRS